MRSVMQYMGMTTPDTVFNTAKQTYVALSRDEHVEDTSRRQIEIVELINGSYLQYLFCLKV